jgi:hypothetical protein
MKLQNSLIFQKLQYQKDTNTNEAKLTINFFQVL